MYARRPARSYYQRTEEAPTLREELKELYTLIEQLAYQQRIDLTEVSDEYVVGKWGERPDRESPVRASGANSSLLHLTTDMKAMVELLLQKGGVRKDKSR